MYCNTDLLTDPANTMIVRKTRSKTIDNGDLQVTQKPPLHGGQEPREKNDDADYFIWHKQPTSIFSFQNIMLVYVSGNKKTQWMRQASQKMTSTD